jgi:hypothetical protein
MHFSFHPIISRNDGANTQPEHNVVKQQHNCLDFQQTVALCSVWDKYRCWLGWDRIWAEDSQRA